MRISRELVRLFVRSAPAIPLFPGPAFGQYTSRRIEGFPTADDPYVALAPYPNPEIAVAATIEQGGFGVDSAAPVVKQILSAYYNTHKQAAKAAGGKAPSQGSIQAPTGAAAGNPY